jgi:hypothetical protein
MHATGDMVKNQRLHRAVKSKQRENNDNIHST